MRKPNGSALSAVADSFWPRWDWSTDGASRHIGMRASRSPKLSKDRRRSGRAVRRRRTALDIGRRNDRHRYDAGDGRPGLRGDCRRCRKTTCSLCQKARLAGRHRRHVDHYASFDPPREGWASPAEHCVHGGAIRQHEDHRAAASEEVSGIACDGRSCLRQAFALRRGAIPDHQWSPARTRLRAIGSPMVPSSMKPMATEGIAVTPTSIEPRYWQRLAACAATVSQLRRYSLKKSLSNVEGAMQLDQAARPPVAQEQDKATLQRRWRRTFAPSAAATSKRRSRVHESPLRPASSSQWWPEMPRMSRPARLLLAPMCRPASHAAPRRAPS